MFCHDVHFNEPWPSAEICRAAIEECHRLDVSTISSLSLSLLTPERDCIATALHHLSTGI